MPGFDIPTFLTVTAVGLSVAVLRTVWLCVRNRVKYTDRGNR